MRIDIRGKHFDKEPIMELYLYKTRTQTVELCGIDANGDDWTIAVIHPEGYHLVGGIGKKSGWSIDEHGKLKMVDKY